MPDWHRPKPLKTRGQSAFLSKPEIGSQKLAGTNAYKSDRITAREPRGLDRLLLLYK